MLAYRLNNLPRAIDLFEMGLAKDPENVNAIQNLALAYAKSKEASKAETFNYKVRIYLFILKYAISYSSNHSIYSSKTSDDCL